MKLRQMILLFVAILALVGVLAACGGNDGESVMDATTPPEQTSTPAATPTATAVPVSLVVCLGEAPNTLNPYGSPNAAAQEILQALYDGPIDQLGYQYQPVLVDSLPSFESGTVQIQPVTVQTADTVLDNNGNPVVLEYGMTVRPAGCYSDECAQEFVGDPIVMDQLVVQFSLLQGITWADGTPLTAADSVYGFNLNTDAASPASKYKVSRTAAYEAVDDITVRWMGLPGYMDPDYQNDFWLPVPQHLWGSLPAAELFSGAFSTDFILGYGPFNLVEVGADSFTLQHNPAYFRAAEGLPSVDNLIFRVVGQDAQTNLDMLATGECDVLDPTAVAGIETGEIDALVGEGGAVASWANADGWTLLNFGVVPQSYDDGYNYWAGDRPDFFGDARTRQAIAMCLDREAILQLLLRGHSPVMDTYLPPDHPLFNPNIATYSKEDDLNNTAAMELLVEVGWQSNAEAVLRASGVEGVPDGQSFSVELLYADYPLNAEIVQMIVDQLAACQIEVTPVAMSEDELFVSGEGTPLFGRNFDMAFFAWQSSVNPACQLWTSEGIPGEDEEIFPYKWGGWNLTGWSNDAYDAACSAARGRAPGMEGYAENHALAQQILAEEVPIIPFYTYQQTALARADICGLQLDATGGLLWNIENMTYGANCP